MPISKAAFFETSHYLSSFQTAFANILNRGPVVFFVVLGYVTSLQVQRFIGTAVGVVVQHHRSLWPSALRQPAHPCGSGKWRHAITAQGCPSTGGQRTDGSCARFWQHRIAHPNKIALPGFSYYGTLAANRKNIKGGRDSKVCI